MLASLLPLRCPGCGRAGDPVCADCAAALVAPRRSAPPRGIDRCVAAFVYEGVAREVVARAKYRRLHAVLGWLADAMVPLVAPPLPAAVTWVPTTAARRRERGFDHAELLARAVAGRVHRPVRRLLRRGAGGPQTGLDAVDRRVGPRLRACQVVPESVLIVDDVVTTGATLAAAAAALRSAGARRVDALAAARTPMRRR